MRIRRLTVVLAASALVLPFAFSTPSVAVSEPPVTFGSAVVVDPINLFGEPDIKFDKLGNVYVSGPQGTGLQRSIWDWSTDGGKTFRPLHSSQISSPDSSATSITGPGGGDTEISIDRTGKVYYSDLAALVTLKVATWDPKTRTMETGVFAKGEDNVNGYDRQWFAMWDPPNPSAVRKSTGYTGPFPVNYLISAQAFKGQITGCCVATSYSLDGINYTDATFAGDIAHNGWIVIDQATGTILEADVIGGDIGVALFRRDPAAPSDPAIRSVERVKAVETPAGVGIGALFPTIAIDEARTAYLVWATPSNDTVSVNKNAWQIWYSYATAESGWKKWSKAVQLSSPPSAQNVMPWSVGGSKGRLAAVWYGTNDTTHDVNVDDEHQAWDVYLASVADADTAHPTVSQVKVTKHPMHYGTICLSGVGCIREQGNRNLADFFQVDVDPKDGAIAVVYNDTSNELAQALPVFDMQIPPPVDGLVDHRGAAVVMVARQNGGIGLFGKPIGGSSLAAASLAGAKGTATFDPVYGSGNIDELDLVGGSLTGNADNLVFRMNISSLAEPANALDATGAKAVNYVVRWVGAPVGDATNVRNPVYYAAVEVGLTGEPMFYAGEARTIDLCSVSACSPKLMDYPAPPVAGTSVTGRLIAGSGGAADQWEITVPRSVVGNPTDTTMLESFSMFTMARNKSASLPLTNIEGQAGIAPVLVDAVCCVDASVAAGRARVLSQKPAPQVSRPGGVSGAPLPGTGVRGAPLWLGAALLAGAAASALRIRRPRTRTVEVERGQRDSVR